LLVLSSIGCRLQREKEKGGCTVSRDVRYVPESVKLKVQEMTGLPWERLTWIGQGSFADTWQLPEPWTAVVRIAYERYNPTQLLETAEKVAKSPPLKHLPTVYAVQLVKADGGYYSIILMKRYRVLGYSKSPEESYDDIYGVWDKVTEEFEVADIPMSNDTHQYNVGYDADGTPVFFDIW
jgi:hypothetical protein